MTETNYGLWNFFMHKTWLWNKKVEKHAKNPYLWGFCTQNLWKSQWIMWISPVDKVENHMFSALYIQFSVYIRVCANCDGMFLRNSANDLFEGEIRDIL